MPDTQVHPERDAAAVVHAHQAEVWRYLRFLGASSELADDLTQETFLQFLRAPYEDRGTAARAAWLRTVARNLYLRSFRRPPLQASEFDEADAAWAAFVRHDGGQEWLLALRACVGELGGRAQQALQLHYEQGCSRHRIGQQLGIGDDGVKSLLRRVRDLLRRCVEEEAGIVSDWQDRLVDAGLRQLAGEQPPEQTAVILHRLQTELAAVTQLPQRPALVPLRLLVGCLLGAAAALLLSLALLPARAPTGQPTVVCIELAGLAGSVECVEPANASRPERRRELHAGEQTEWRAQVGGGLHSRSGAELSVRPFGVLATTTDTTMEVRSMEFTVKNGAIAAGALTFAVVAGVATWHTLTRSESAAAGQELRLEAPAADAEKAALALARQQQLEQQNQELRTRVQQLETQLARRIAEAPPAAVPEQPAPVTAPEPAAGSGPVFTDEKFQELLASIDWNMVGSTSAEMGPKLVALMQDLAAGKELSMEDAIAIQKLNGKLLDMVPKLMQSGLPGFGPNGLFTHPLVAGNSLASMLQASGQTLSGDQQAALQSLVRSFAAESQTVHDTQCHFELEKLAAETAMKDRFYEAMASNLTPEQRALMYPEGAGGYEGSSLFSSGLIWAAHNRGVPSLDSREFARITSDGLGQHLGLDEQSAAVVRAVIERVADKNRALWQDMGTPLELRSQPSFLKTGRGAQALQMQLQWMRELQNSGALTPQQLDKLRSLPRVFVPVPR